MSRFRSRASVALPGGAAEVRSFPVRPCGAEDGWLRVESSAVCGTDVTWAAHKLAEPTILGHHVVGTVQEVGSSAARRWSLTDGDRVAVEEYLPCRNCPSCVAGRYRLCPQTDLWGAQRRVGMVPVAEHPALWGGNAEFMYLPPNAVLHRLPLGLSAQLAAWTQPLGNALDWILGAGQLHRGETVLILGPGYHGLAAVAAARHGGAGQIVVVGTERDRRRLRIAAELGADTFVGLEGAAERVRELTGGGKADVVLDVAGSDPASVPTALSLLARHGRLVVAGIKQPSEAPIETEDLVSGLITIRGVRGRAPERIREAISVLAEGGAGLEGVPSAEVPLDDVGPTLARLAAGTGPATPHVVIRPDHADTRTIDQSSGVSP